MIPMINVGDILICPVCNKEFKATEDTKYIAKGGYICEWKCFLDRDKECRSKQSEKK